MAYLYEGRTGSIGRPPCESGNAYVQKIGRFGSTQPSFLMIRRLHDTLPNSGARLTRVAHITRALVA